MITVIVESPDRYNESQFEEWSGARDYAVRMLHDQDTGNEYAGRRWRDQGTKRILEVPNEDTARAHAHCRDHRIHAGEISVTFAGREVGEE